MAAPSRSLPLDVLRCLAVLLVLLHHSLFAWLPTMPVPMWLARALQRGGSWRWTACAATTLTFVVALASADEARQGISTARTGSTWNVLLDVSGASVALVIVIALQLWLRRPLFPRPRSRSV